MQTRAKKCNSILLFAIGILGIPLGVLAVEPVAEGEIVGTGDATLSADEWGGWDEYLRELCLLVPCPVQTPPQEPVKSSVEAEMRERIAAYLAGGVQAGLTLDEKQDGLALLAEMQVRLLTPPADADAALMEDMKRTLAMMQVELSLP